MLNIISISALTSQTASSLPTKYRHAIRYICDAIRHGGETRQDRLEEFLAVNPHVTVAGLREGTALWVENDKITLKGERNLRIMRHEQKAFEITPESVFDFAFNLR